MRIGIDLGGSHIAVAIVSKRNTIVAKKEKDIPNIQNIENIKEFIVDNIKVLIREVLKEVGAPSCVISKIGIAVPGKIKDKIIYDMYNLGIKELDLVQILEEYYNAKVNVRNDAKCAALAEKNIGSLQSYDDAVFLCLGTGIGGAKWQTKKW